MRPLRITISSRTRRGVARLAKRMEVSSDREAVLMPNARKSPALRSRWTHLSREGPPPLAHIDQRQHSEGAVGVLDQAAIAGLGEAPQALEGQERMLDLGAHRGLPAIGLPVCLGERPVLVHPLIGEVLGLRRDVLESLALLLGPGRQCRHRAESPHQAAGWAAPGCRARCPR